MEFKTTSNWKNQISILEEGFTFNSNSYKYSDVIKMWGVYESINVNFVRSPYLDDFAFEIYLSNEITLKQTTARTSMAKAVFSIGLLYSNDEVAMELQQLFHLLLQKTYASRVKKYYDYYEKHNRWLLGCSCHPNSRDTRLKDNDPTRLISGDEEGNIFVNDSLFGNWRPGGNCQATNQTGGGSQQGLIRFRKSNTMLDKLKGGFIYDKENDCYVNIWDDPDIFSQNLKKIKLRFS